jgi:hypothetical protein
MASERLGLSLCPLCRFLGCLAIHISEVTASAFARTFGGCGHATGQASFEAETPTKSAALTALGAGLGLSLVGSASASTLLAADIPQADNNSSDHRFVLNKEEMADVNLATFHLFDREHGTAGLQQTAWVRGCRRGCRAAASCVRCRVRWLRGLWRLLPVLGTVPLVLSSATLTSRDQRRL